MIPVFQNDSPEKNGTCVRSCLASIFEVSIEDMPEFENMDKSVFLDEIRKWVHNFGYSISVGNGHKYNGEYYLTIVSINSVPAGSHCTIFKNGRLFHDPLDGKYEIGKHTKAIVFNRLSESAKEIHDKELG